MSRSIGCILFVLLSALPGRASVIVVDPAGAPGAPLLQAAIAGARSGDIILLRAGDYTGLAVTLDHGDMALVADTGARPEISGLIVDGGSVVVRGLGVRPPPSAGSSCLVMPAASLWMEECSVQGLPPTNPAFSGPAAVFVSGSGLVLIRSEVHGGNGQDAGVEPDGTPVPTTTGNSALMAAYFSTVVVQQSTLAAGAQGDGPDPPYFASAGDAIDLAFARVSLLGAELIGGDEGADNGATSTPGFALSGPFGDVDARDTTFAAGMVQGAGTPVPPLNLLSSSLVTYPASMRTLSIPCPLRELEPAFASVHGEPGDLAFVLVAATSDLASLPDKEGVLVVATTPQPLLLPLGTVSDASGQLDARIVLPRLPVGVDGMVLFTQLGVVSSQGDALLGTGSAVVWLSAAL